MRRRRRWDWGSEEEEDGGREAGEEEGLVEIESERGGESGEDDEETKGEEGEEAGRRVAEGVGSRLLAKADCETGEMMAREERAVRFWW